VHLVGFIIRIILIVCLTISVLLLCLYHIIVYMGMPVERDFSFVTKDKTKTNFVAGRADKQVNVGDRPWCGAICHEVITVLEVSKVEDVRQQWRWMWLVSNPNSCARTLRPQSSHG